MAADAIASDIDQPIVFTLSEQDYVRANRLHLFATYKKLRSYRALLVLALLYWALIFFSGGCYCVKAAAMAAVYASVGAIVVVAACITLGLITLPFRSRRLFRQSKLAQQEQSVTITPETIRFDAASYNIRQPWGDFIRWGENSRFFMLYVIDRQFHILPARALTQNKRAAIRDVLEKAGVPKQR